MEGFRTFLSRIRFENRIRLFFGSRLYHRHKRRGRFPVLNPDRIFCGGEETRTLKYTHCKCGAVTILLHPLVVRPYLLLIDAFVLLIYRGPIYETLKGTLYYVANIRFERHLKVPNFSCYRITLYSRNLVGMEGLEPPKFRA